MRLDELFGPDHELELPLPALAQAAVFGTGRNRAVALWRLAELVCENLAEYRKPPAPAVPEVLRNVPLEDLVARLQHADFAKVFHLHRSVVLRHEEDCARRLTVLLGTARTLHRLREGAHDPERIDECLQKLAGFVAFAWRTDLPLGCFDRNWSLRVSRRYDLLPIAWRYV